MIVLSPISSRCIVKLYSRQKQVFQYMYLHNYQLQLQPITPKVNMCRSILVQARTDALFVRETGDARLMRVPAYFATSPVVVNDAQDYNIDALQSNLEHTVEQWNKRWSNFNIERVSRFVLSVHPYRPLQGSAFVRTPEFLAKKHCLINVNTMTKNASFGACCRRYTQPLMTTTFVKVQRLRTLS